MSDRAPSICFQCGQNADERTRLNRLSGGDPCPACSDRLMTTLPPLLPGFATIAEPEVEEFGDPAADTGPTLGEDRPA